MCMNLLKTEPIRIGSETYLLSEYTALDRLLDMEYAVSQPAIPEPDEEDTLAKAKHQIAVERRQLNLVSHSIALSLPHNNECFAEVPTSELQQIIQAQWPNRKLNQAYELVWNLNRTPDTDDQPDVASEDVTPEKP